MVLESSNHCSMQVKLFKDMVDSTEFQLCTVWCGIHLEWWNHYKIGLLEKMETQVIKLYCSILKIFIKQIQKEEPNMSLVSKKVLFVLDDHFFFCKENHKINSFQITLRANRISFHVFRIFWSISRKFLPLEILNHQHFYTYTSRSVLIGNLEEKHYNTF